MNCGGNGRGDRIVTASLVERWPNGDVPYQVATTFTTGEMAIIEEV